jgi:thiamine-monophosphate kinase
LTCDPVVEGVHFDRDTAPELIGAKAVGRNLSDLAAIGAVADYLLVSLLLPAGFGATAQDALLRGIERAADEHGCAVIGGDTSASPGPLVVTITAVGHLEGPPLLRSAARPGDRIHLTGPVGGSRSGRHLRIRPRLVEGRWLAALPGIGAGIDVSDGLALDLATLLRASSAAAGQELGAELDATAIPIHDDAQRLADPLRHALGDGEDHELLFTWRAGAALPDRGPLADVARRPFGRVLAEPGLWLRGADGSRTRLEPLGHEHPIQR